MVLPNVFRTQFHLACFDVVARLDEGCVKHNSTECTVTEASVFKQNLNIPIKCPPFALAL